MNKTGIVILAGGKGQRIGGNKPHRLFDGRRLIDHAIELAKGWNQPTAISVHEAGQVEQDRLPEIVDNPDTPGPLGGLLAAFDWARAGGLEGFLTLPCDMPMLPAEVLARLQGASEIAKCPTVACCSDRCHPVCAFWPVSYFGDIQTYAKMGRRSLSGALKACGAVNVVWPESDKGMFININHLSELNGPGS